MADVRCIKCGLLEYRTPGVLCDSCFEIACDQFAADQIKFRKLISAGVSRRMANEIMIARIENGLPN